MAGGGLVLSEQAAEDLHVTVGSRLAVRHPRRVGTGYELVTSQLTVGALQPGPLRSLAFLDLGRAEVFNLSGLTNVVEVRPVAGVGDDALVRAVFVQPGWDQWRASPPRSEPPEALEEFFGVLRIVQVVVLLLAVLIAFNATGIGIDEAARQHATMLAFGLRPRTVLTIAAAEMALVGLVGTLLGLAGGRAVTAWSRDRSSSARCPRSASRPISPRARSSPRPSSGSSQWPPHAVAGPARPGDGRPGDAAGPRMTAGATMPLPDPELSPVISSSSSAVVG